MTVNGDSNNIHQLNTHRGIDINMCYMNVRSFKNITTYLNKSYYNKFSINDTWLNCTATNSTYMYINALLPSGYFMHHIDRNNEQTGGLAVVYKQHLNLKLCNLDGKFSQFEYIKCRLNTDDNNIDIVVFYSPPPPHTHTHKVIDSLSVNL